MKLFVTGDNHIGRRFDSMPDIRAQLIASRFASFEGMVKRAEAEGCDFFVITGDLFDRISGITKTDMVRTIDILSEFSGRILVLPGNHDYYTGDEKVWQDFESYAAAHTNIILLKEYRVYPFELEGETLEVYPAFCDSHYGKENRLGWIRGALAEAPDREDCYRVGIAHGALESVTPDMKGVYFPMGLTELNAIPVDAWLIGHTHIPYPKLEAEKELGGYRIFNAGTHEQLDLHNDTEGNAFVITLTQQDGITSVTSKRIITGAMHYYDLSCRLSAAEETRLAEALGELLAPCEDASVVRVHLSGSLSAGDYEERYAIAKAAGARFLHCEILLEDLTEEITMEKIREEYSELSFASRFLEELLGDPLELQMAYELVKKCE